MIIDILQQRLLDRAENNSLRKLETNQGFIDFFSNDYLSIAQNQTIYHQIQDELHHLKQFKNGSTGSRLLSGNSKYTELIEKELAHFFHSESALIFNSGYNANLAILSAIPQKGDTIIYDDLIHTSLKDGARLSFADRYSFKHNDIIDLDKKLTKSKGQKFVVVESVYSMDGDCCPIEEIIDICNKHKAQLIVDEAHTTGVIGQKGQGYCIDKKLEEKIFARIYTFGKGMGIHGACIVGSKVLTQYLINFARPFIYTTALPDHSIAAIRVAFAYAASEEGKSKRILLQNNITAFQKYILPDLKEFYIPSSSAIQVLKLGSIEKAKFIAKKLKENKLDVRPILSPTVKKGEERIRICIHAHNSLEQIESLSNYLKANL